MAKSRKPNTRADLSSNVVNALSAASEAIETAQNTLTSLSGSGSYGIVQPSSTTVPAGPWNIMPQAVPTASGTTNTFYGINPFDLLQTYDNGYPKVDISVCSAVFHPGLPASLAYRIEIFAAGVPKENITLEIEEGSTSSVSPHPPTLTITIAKNEHAERDINYVTKESKNTFTKRIVYLPANTNIENVSVATHYNGVLGFCVGRHLDEPKLVRAKSVKIT